MLHSNIPVAMGFLDLDFILRKSRNGVHASEAGNHRKRQFVINFHGITIEGEPQPAMGSNPTNS